jgi:ABC-type amino acid transport substrate-binding protein
MKKITLPCLFLLLALPLFSQWNSSPTVNNLVANTPQNDTEPLAISDGAGGSIQIFFSGNNVAVQKITASGNIAWGGTANPKLLIENADSQDKGDLQGVSDGNGGVFIAYALYTGGVENGEIYLQHFDAAGNNLWGSQGTKITNTPAVDDFYPTLCADGAGGAIVGWHSDNLVNNVQMMAQRCNSAGVPQWAANGLQVCTAPGLRVGGLVTDGAGGAICIFSDSRNDPDASYENSDEITNLDIYAQRLNANGQRLWAENGIAFCVADGYQSTDEIFVDGLGGAFAIVYEYDFETETYTQFVQRINNAGQPQWANKGVLVATDETTAITLVADGTGGAVILSYSILPDKEHFAYQTQKITPAGALAWGAGGKTLTEGDVDEKFKPIVIHDGLGNFIYAFEKYVQNIGYNVRLQKLNTDGNPQWGNDGALVCDVNELAYNSITMALADNAAVMVSWGDNRNQSVTQTDIYASKVLASGTLEGSSAVSEYITTANGNWNSPATWVGGVVPPAGAVVIIRHQITITQNVSCYSLKAETLAGKITVAAGVTVNITH